MVTIHEKTAQTFNTLGLGALLPSSCVVTEELNGAFELEMEHPYDADGKWKRIEEGCIIYASTPRGRQPFRIYRIRPDMNGITVNARHIFYDLLDNQCSPISYGGTASGALSALRSAFAYSMPFTFTTNISTSGTISTGRMNPIQALLSDDDDTTSFVSGFGGEVLRDGFNVSIKTSMGQDRDVAIRYGKNLIGLEVTQDESDVKTRIQCYGKNGSATVNSPYIGAYLYPKIYTLEDENKTIAELREEAQALLDSGVDIPLVNIKVDFIPLSKTAEYKNYAILEDVQLGDIVTVIHNKMNFSKRARVISYEWDCILEQYNEVELGDFMPTLASSVTSGVRSGNLASAAVVNASAVMATLQDHMNDYQNPHRVTAAQTGGSGGGGGTGDVQEELNTHIDDKNNPHGVTAEQVGAYTKQEVDTKLQSLPSGGTSILYGADAPDDAIGNDGDAYVQMAEYMEYTPVEYIESIGSQYINTNYFLTSNNLRVVIDFEYTTSHNGLSLFGNHTSVPYSVTVYGSVPQFYVGSGSSGITCGSQTSLNTRYTLDVTANNGQLVAIWNGTKYTATCSGMLYKDLPFFIFGSNANGSLGESGNGYRLYSIQFYDNDTMVRDYIPVIDASGVACLYDKVSQTYFYNAGTGTFTAGAELPKEAAGGALYIKINGTWELAMKGAE